MRGGWQLPQQVRGGSLPSFSDENVLDLEFACYLLPKSSQAAGNVDSPALVTNMWGSVYKI